MGAAFISPAFLKRIVSNHMKKIEFYTEKSADFSNAVAGVAVVVMMLVIVCDVTMRFFKVSLPGSYDVVGLMGTVVAAFALTYTTIQRGHIAVDFLYRRVSKRYRPVLDVFNGFVSTAFFALLAWQSFIYAAELKNAGEVSLTIQVPVYPFVAGIGLNCTLLSVYLLLHFVRSTRGVFKR